MPKARPAQTAALDFIDEAVRNGYRDIVVAAPTGSGKSGIGAAAALWAGSFDLAGNYCRGGYYLVTQKMLQDQLERDFSRWTPKFSVEGASIRSSVEYPCPSFGTCMAGGMALAAEKGEKCTQRSDKSCPYTVAKSNFCASTVAVTNYPYLFTEHHHLGELPARNMLVADECHTLEKQIISFIEIVINKSMLDTWAPSCRPVPEMHSSAEFVQWLRQSYMHVCKERYAMLKTSLESSSYVDESAAELERAKQKKRVEDEINALKNHLDHVEYAVDSLDNNPEHWVFWQEKVDEEFTCTAKPLSAAPFAPKMLNTMGAIRLYMSAYPGPKSVFCRSLGLNEDAVAWLDLDSSFPVENRLIHLTYVGSMSRKREAETTPRLLSMCETILQAHPNEKGLLHCNSYRLGKLICDHLSTTSERSRIIFAAQASERLDCFKNHQQASKATVFVSPSITEGFSFDDDLARFQIIAKCPFPFLGDRQISARMKNDPEWYALQAAQTIIQATGRIVRSETDSGVTYIIDSDFARLYADNPSFFPDWWVASVRSYN